MTTDLALPLFPEIDPIIHGWLPVSGGHQIYYELCGNQQGSPVVVLHGGPGSGCTPGQRRFFDPEHYLIILFDQRGCGRSLPAGCIEQNTTAHLVDDIEALRKHLHINRWLVFGGSWGSTLALAYAASHPEAITGLVLRGIFLSRQSELDWFLYQVKQFFPEPWEQLVAPLAPSERSDILNAYINRIFGNDHDLAIQAARNWNTFESAIMFLIPPSGGSNMVDDSSSLARARVQLHYLSNLCFLQDRPLLQQVARFRHIPTTIIQGRYDMVCPPHTAYELHQAWPEAHFVTVPDAGHAAVEPGTRSALIQATESFKQRS